MCIRHKQWHVGIGARMRKRYSGKETQAFGAEVVKADRGHLGRERLCEREVEVRMHSRQRTGDIHLNT